MNINGRLVIGIGRENLRFRSRNGGVAVNHSGEDAACGFNAEGQRGYVKEQYVFNFACQYACLNGSADSNTFIRVYAAVRFFAHEFFNSFLHGRDTGRAAYEDNFVDVAGAHACVGHSLTGRAHGAFNKVCGHFFKFSAGQVHIKVFRAICAGGNERQVNVGAHNAGKFNFSFFGCFTQTLHCHAVSAKVDAFSFFKFVDHPVDDAFIKVVAAEVGIAVGSFNFKYAVAYIKDGYIEGAAAKVVNHNGVVFALINAVSKCCGGRFVDDTQNFKTCNFACVLSSLALAVGEVSRYGNNGLAYGFAKVFFSVSF